MTTAHHHTSTSVFALPEHLSAKADPDLVAGDDAHFAAVSGALDRRLAEDGRRLDALRRQPRGSGEYALERDAGIRRLSSRLLLLQRFGLDLVLGRMVSGDGSGTTVYVGRTGLTDGDGHHLLIDWRSPAAEPFFAATHAHPLGQASRRYRWSRGRITDYWDEVFTTAGLSGGPQARAALDDQSAFIASLGAHRTPRMQDVLGTLQADQDAIIRAGSRGALVVDGGPGTGKTVVALHRTAHLLYADERLRRHRGGVLVVGPHEPYLAYVADVLPSLGEDGVLTTTVRGLLPEGATVPAEVDPRVADLKARRDLVDAVEPAVRLYEEPPSDALLVETPWGEVWLSPEDWAEAFDAPDSGTPHNEARQDVWTALLQILAEGHSAATDPDAAVDEEDGGPATELLYRSFEANRELRAAFARAWPVLRAEEIVGDLFTVPAYVSRCAPALEPSEVRSLQRADPQAWTLSDLPILDAARRRIGDPHTASIRRARDQAHERNQGALDRVIDELVAADDSDLQLMTSLRTEDIRDQLVVDDDLSAADRDPLAGPFEHIVVDEAQELTDAEWRMLLDRCPSRSLTIVGDRAQARRGFTESWRQRLERVGVGPVEIATLSINYRTPEEVMAEAAPVIRAEIPDARVPTSVRASGIAVHHGTVDELDEVLDAWLEEHDQGEGTAVVISADGTAAAGPVRGRVRSLTPALAKGLEFDLVILVDPQDFGPGIEGAVDRYVAMSRATRQLVILED
ncbi:RNA polymerase recycling motor ATPase HelR [Citricoccus sp.]|uniref:RNA polymerase recycling motor ATPase HelR n=1 Tax=Citricoccus sp. TaxID=1978372 RepID=UPI0028BE9E5D|nr:RNA polymerase recycling motor ATPase HelR [Citricoccus sp.]